MEGDPLGFFGLLLQVCIRDDPDSKRSLMTATAISFALGMVASGITTYFLGVAHLL